MFATRTAFFLPAISFLLTLMPLAAQDSATGSIRGTVFDASGGRISQASVVIVNSATSARHMLTTDGEGRFTLGMLPSGDYSARVETPGMSPEVTPQLHVDVGGTAELFISSWPARKKRSPSQPPRCWWKPSPAQSQPCSTSARSTISRLTAADFPISPSSRRVSLKILAVSLPQPTAISPSVAFAGFRTRSWSMAAITITPSSPRHADVSAHPTTSPVRSCRSSACHRTPTERSRADPAARS
jgi:Carboxypeptidase regulatory-like domain